MLEPPRVDLPRPNPDADGARWRHATIRYGLLFVYSPGTQFEATEPGAPHGYTRFRAYAVLQHGGDELMGHQAGRRGSAAAA